MNDATTLFERAPAAAPTSPLPTETAISELVDRFYAKVRKDAALGPIFERAIGDDWDAHLAIMRDFWSSIMLTSGRYHRNAIAVHRTVEGITPAMFERWLALFAETCDELFDAALAQAFVVKAVRIAERLKLALFHAPGQPFPPPRGAP